MRLFHYCCRCSARLITARGFLRPRGRELFGVDLVWLTDLDPPDRAALGLTSRILTCDRLEFQYVVTLDPPEAEPWLGSDVRAHCVRDSGFEEFEEGRNPERWYIARRAVFAVRNRAYRNLAPIRPSSVRVELAEF